MSKQNIEVSTIHDVAKLAGVSKSTVSRVLNQSKAVKPQVKRAVNDAIKKLNYTPSYFAQGIRTGKTKMIAMLVPDCSNIFYSELFRGVESVAENAGYMALFCNTDRRVEREYKYIRKLVDRNIDGIIYHTYNLNYDNIDFLNKLSSYIPIVFMDSIFQNDPHLCYVITEGIESTAMAVKYLYDQGRRRVAYIKMMPKISIIENRFQGYLKGLGKCGLPLDEDLIYQMDNSNVLTDDLSIGMAAANYFLSLPNLPDSILTSCDVLAIGCMRELKKKGISIPKDIAIIGFDNIAYCELVEPTLTTIAQPISKLGSVAAQIIIDKLDGKAVEEKVIFPGELIIREST